MNGMISFICLLYLSYISALLRQPRFSSTFCLWLSYLRKVNYEALSLRHLPPRRVMMLYFWVICGGKKDLGFDEGPLSHFVPQPPHGGS